MDVILENLARVRIPSHDTGATLKPQTGLCT